MDIVQSQPYDLLLRGGRVIDPAQGLDGILDVAVSDGRIAAVRPEPRRARRRRRSTSAASWCCPA